MPNSTRIIFGEPISTTENELEERVSYELPTHEGSVGLIEHKDRLYVATNKAVYCKDDLGILRPLRVADSRSDIELRQDSYNTMVNREQRTNRKMKILLKFINEICKDSIDDRVRVAALAACNKCNKIA